MSKSEVPGARVGDVDSGISNMQVAFQARQLGEAIPEENVGMKKESKLWYTAVFHSKTESKAD